MYVCVRKAKAHTLVGTGSSASTHRIRKAKGVGKAELPESATLYPGAASDFAFLPCSPDAWRESGFRV
jgi:hypothetical protein